MQQAHKGMLFMLIMTKYCQPALLFCLKLNAEQQCRNLLVQVVDPQALRKLLQEMQVASDKQRLAMS